jgi:hypothetical protein
MEGGEGRGGGETDGATFHLVFLFFLLSTRDHLFSFTQFL